jgi:hypothetical protein
MGLLAGDLMVYGHFESVAKFQSFPWRELGLSNLFNGAFWATNGPILKSFLKPFVLGSTLVGLCAGTTSYWLTFKLCITNPEETA